MFNGKILAFDLDDVLCVRKINYGGVDKYRTCSPIQKNIDILNECAELGAKIIVYTARGMSIFKGDISEVYSNLYVLTESQLKEWGVRYDKLVMGKIHYDLLIDDKVLNSENIDDIKERLK